MKSFPFLYRMNVPAYNHRQRNTVVPEGMSPSILLPSREMHHDGDALEPADLLDGVGEESGIRCGDNVGMVHHDLEPRGHEARLRYVIELQGPVPDQRGGVGGGDV